MRSGLVLVLTIACGGGGREGARPSAGATAVTRDAGGAAATDAAASGADAAAPTARWRSGVVVPVVALAERRFVPLVGWFLPADGAAAVPPADDAPVTVIEATPRSSVQPRVAVSAAMPASWRAAVGAKVATYDRAGNPCAATIREVLWLGLDNGPDVLGERPFVVAELTVAPGCDPVVVTDRPDPRFAAPAAVPAKVRAAVTRAFDRLPETRRVRAAGKRRDELAMEAFVGADGAWVVAAAVFAVPDATCDGEPEVVRALFATPAGQGVTLVDGDMGAEAGLRAVAVFDSDRDGHLELVTDHGRFDHGMSMETSYARYFDLSPGEPPPDGPTTDVSFSTYFGCD